MPTAKTFAIGRAPSSNARPVLEPDPHGKLGCLNSRLASLRPGLRDRQGLGSKHLHPGHPKGKFPIKFAMVLADDPLSRQIAPQGLMGVGSEAYLDPECP